MVTEINVFLCAIPYDLWTNAKEATYRTYISWCLQLSVTNKVRSETLNNRGRSDLEFTLNDCTYIIELKRLPQQKDPKNAVKLADVAQQQVYDRGYGFNDQVDGDTKRYGLALVIAERSRQIEYWRYFAGPHVIAENAVHPISMDTPPQPAKWLLPPIRSSTCYPLAADRSHEATVPCCQAPKKAPDGAFL